MHTQSGLRHHAEERDLVWPAKHGCLCYDSAISVDFEYFLFKKELARGSHKGHKASPGN